MNEHVCRAPGIAHGTMVITEAGGSYETEFKQEAHEYETFECSCGETFDSIDEAEEHVVEATDD